MSTAPDTIEKLQKIISDWEPVSEAMGDEIKTLKDAAEEIGARRLAMGVLVPGRPPLLRLVAATEPRCPECGWKGSHLCTCPRFRP